MKEKTYITHKAPTYPAHCSTVMDLVNYIGYVDNLLNLERYADLFFQSMLWT